MASLCHKDNAMRAQPGNIWQQEGEEEGGEGEGAVGGMALERRGALVPQRSGRESSGSRQEELTTSVAVIPPMQICPGDLLVYSRVLAHKASGYGEWEVWGGFYRAIYLTQQ